LTPARAAVLGLLVVCRPGAVSASEPELFGLGGRSAALGGTGAADAEGYEATYANPAGLAPRPGEAAPRRLTVGYVGARDRVSLDGAHHPVDATDGVLIGASLPIPFGGPLKDRVGIGLGFYFPTGVITAAKTPFPDQPRLALLDERTQVVSILLAAGARLYRRVRVGAGVLALAALLGEIDIKPDAAGRITTVAEEQLVTRFSPVVGARVRASSWFDVGLVLRGESSSSYDLKIKNTLGNLVPIQLPQIRVAGVAQFDPLQLQLEGAARLDLVRVAAGLTWKHWSAFPLPSENATVGAPAQPPPGYHDTAVPRLGVEVGGWRSPFRVVGRAGYFFEWSPAPARAATLVDADRHVLTCGFGVTWVSRLTTLVLDGFAQWHHLGPHPRAAGDLAVFGGSLGVDL
jgi:long-chain fatty acid transport protein